MRSGSLIWLSVAGPLAQFRPRLPGCTGLPSNLLISSVVLSTYARSPHAASQLKQVVGIRAKRRLTFFGQAAAS